MKRPFETGVQGAAVALFLAWPDRPEDIDRIADTAHETLRVMSCDAGPAMVTATQNVLPLFENW